MSSITKKKVLVLGPVQVCFATKDFAELTVKAVGQSTSITIKVQESQPGA